MGKKCSIYFVFQVAKSFATEILKKRNAVDNEDYARTIKRNRCSTEQDTSDILNIGEGACTDEENENKRNVWQTKNEQESLEEATVETSTSITVPEDMMLQIIR